jgi:hypothetical protein
MVIRKLIQSKLDELEEVECYATIVEDFEMLEYGTTYFFYSLKDSLIDMSGTHLLSLEGYVVRKENDDNSLQYVDDATEEIIEKLRELNIHTNWEDASNREVSVMIIVGTTNYNEANYGLI